ncbi:uncharacterized protein LOC132714857 [Ruditapes philippinarum]|uniref:uncharacterized protein LOC132714857 n=1 Tax=Ruditapes philippinarum TaxID=129788 RepID=UPI00295B6105|nr:uncharacterized protein LOC132714857 [Ruditapes philippinarum]
MKSGHIVILQLCFIFVLCAKLSRKQLEQRLQAMQTLIFQDTQIMKEGIRNNAEGLQTLAKNMQKNSDLLQETLSFVRNVNLQDAKSKDAEIQYNPNTQVNISNIKILQRAFKELKMHSLSLQVNTFNQLEEFLEQQNTFMKNISLYLATMESKDRDELNENLISNIKKLASCANNNQDSTPGTLLVEYSKILKKAESVLTEVINGQSIISNSLSRFTPYQTNAEDKITSSCFNVVYSKDTDVANNENDHNCYNISAQPGKRVTFHCGNRNIRLGDALITEVAVEGRIEVKYNNHWGTVCQDGFDQKDAIAACRSAGFARGVEENRVHKGSGQIWLSHLSFKGGEQELFDCKRSYGIGYHRCDHSEDAGVRCFWLP